MPREPKSTFGEMRASGVRGVLIYCSDYRCSHFTKAIADGWDDGLRLSDVEDSFVCKRCGRRGADIRPDFDWNRAEPAGGIRSEGRLSRNETPSPGLNPGCCVEFEYAYLAVDPMGDDQDTYLVLDDFGGHVGTAWRAADPGHSSFESVIRDRLQGQ
jgi:hypothetical protein